MRRRRQAALVLVAAALAALLATWWRRASNDFRLPPRISIADLVADLSAGFDHGAVMEVSAGDGRESRSGRPVSAARHVEAPGSSWRASDQRGCRADADVARAPSVQRPRSAAAPSATAPTRAPASPRGCR